jgi:cell division control protein 45
MSRGAQRSLKRAQSRLLADYYTGGTYYANSVSGTIYQLVNQLGKSNNDLLWYATTNLMIG